MTQRGPYKRRSPVVTGKAPRSKYNARRTTVDGFTFDSAAEAKRYQELLYLGMAGELRNLELQPRFPITMAGEQVATYVADFRYERRGFDLVCFGDGMTFPVEGWRDVVEDVKGMDTPISKFKRKCIRALYGIDVQVIR